METKNEIAKTETRALSGTLKAQNELVAELDLSAAETGVAFSDYGKKCVMNAIAGLVTMAQSQGIGFNQINGSLLKLALQNIGYTELNYAAMPSEVYFDLRKLTDDKGNVTYTPSMKPQGAGNEKLVRKYGVNIKELKPAWLVRDGDEFSYPSFNGIEMTPPKWTPKSYDKKVMMVVYPLIKQDGSVEFLISTREGIKPNIIAQIRQNALYSFKIEKTNAKGVKYETVDKEARDAFYAKLDADAENMTVDELISNQEYSKYVNPTYTSGGSKESMILRKMKNNALKNYPKEYDSATMRNAVENMWEDKDDSVFEKPKVEKDVVAKVEKEIAETNTTEAVKDFSVDEDGVVEVKPKAAEEPKKEEAAADEEYPF